MEKVQVAIEGISPLLMHRFPMVPIEALEKKPPEEQARLALYEVDGKPYIPGVNVQRMLVAAALFSKGKGRGSLQKAVGACLMVEEAVLEITPPTWVVDARPVVIPATKGRVVRYRPCFNRWAVSFHVTYDETLLTKAQVKRVLEDAGARVGLLDFRPACKGPFGRFLVTRFVDVG